MPDWSEDQTSLLEILSSISAVGISSPSLSPSTPNAASAALASAIEYELEEILAIISRLDDLDLKCTHAVARDGRIDSELLEGSFSTLIQSIVALTPSATSVAPVSSLSSSSSSSLLSSSSSLKNGIPAAVTAPHHWVALAALARVTEGIRVAVRQRKLDEGSTASVQRLNEPIEYMSEKSRAYEAESIAANFRYWHSMRNSNTNASSSSSPAGSMDLQTSSSITNTTSTSSMSRLSIVHAKRPRAQRSSESLGIAGSSLTSLLSGSSPAVGIHPVVGELRSISILLERIARLRLSLYRRSTSAPIDRTTGSGTGEPAAAGTSASSSSSTSIDHLASRFYSRYNFVAVLLLLSQLYQTQAGSHYCDASLLLHRYIEETTDWESERQWRVQRKQSMISGQSDALVCAQQNLAQLALLLGKSGLSFDDNYSCIIPIDNEFSLHLGYVLSTKKLFVYSQVLSRLPRLPEQRLKLYTKLLKGSMLGGQMAGGGVGISLTDDLVLMHCTIDMHNASTFALRLLVPTFIETVRKWRQRALACVATNALERFLFNTEDYGNLAKFLQRCLDASLNNVELGGEQCYVLLENCMGGPVARMPDLCELLAEMGCHVDTTARVVAYPRDPELLLAAQSRLQAGMAKFGSGTSFDQSAILLETELASVVISDEPLLALQRQEQQQQERQQKQQQQQHTKRSKNAATTDAATASPTPNRAIVIDLTTPPTTPSAPIELIDIDSPLLAPPGTPVEERRRRVSLYHQVHALDPTQSRSHVIELLEEAGWDDEVPAALQLERNVNTSDTAAAAAASAPSDQVPPPASALVDSDLVEQWMAVTQVTDVQTAIEFLTRAESNLEVLYLRASRADECGSSYQQVALTVFVTAAIERHLELLG